MTVASPSPQELKLVIFQLDAQRYAVELARVVRVIRMVAVSAFPKAPPIVFGVIDLHGELIAVVDVRQRFRLPKHAPSPDDQLLIVRTARRKLGLIVQFVESVIGVDPAALIGPEKVVPGLDYVRGIVGLPEGIVFVHDIDSFLSLDEERELSAALAGAPP